MSEGEARGLDEARIREILEEYRLAYERRDRAALLDFYADDAVVTIAAGAFAGKQAIEAVVDWDLRGNQAVHVRPLGVGLLVHGNVAVREAVFEAVWEGVSYEYPCLAVFEFDDDGKIRRYRSYYDKLGIEQRLTRQLSGVEGRLGRLMVDRLVRAGEKGLGARGVAEWWTAGESNP